jgi:hypothetical protein
MNSNIKTKKEVLSDYSEYKTLINAVVNRIGLDSIKDVNRHGIGGGFSGFIYYTETHAFAMRYRKLIVALLEEQAEQLGEDVVSMVSHFGAFRNNPMDNEDKRDLYRYLGGGKCEQSAITNLMAWFAAEEVCRMFDC